jgi:restriction system protein
MARQKRQARGTRREKAIKKLMALGGAFVLLPLFAGNTMFGKVLAPLMPIGLVLLVGGGVFLWLVRRSSAPTTPPIAATEPSAPPTAWSRAVFDVIEWRRFEAVIEVLFQQAGFETKTQSHGADQGIDVWLYSKHAPGQAVGIVQCKHWTKRVGVDKIRELRGVMAAHGIRRGQFATTSSFTTDAMDFAKANAVNLLDVAALLKLIGERTAEQQRALLAVALEGDYARPTCVNCGVKMVERHRKRDGAAFWACSKYSCKTTMPMRRSDQAA